MSYIGVVRLVQTKVQEIATVFIAILCHSISGVLLYAIAALLPLSKCQSNNMHLRINLWYINTLQKCNTVSHIACYDISSGYLILLYTIYMCICTMGYISLR